MGRRNVFSADGDCLDNPPRAAYPGGDELREGEGMTEYEWLTCNDLDRMLKHLRGRISERKLRLFTAACIPLLTPYLDRKRCERVLRVLERYAEGMDCAEELDAVRQEAEHGRLVGQVYGTICVEQSVWATTQTSPFGTAWTTSRGVAHALGILQRDRDGAPYWDAKRHAEGGVAAILQDVFGPLLFRPVTVSPTTLVWSGGTVTRLGEAIYVDKRFKDLPVLADALEDAGCADADILGHLRGPGPHVRGCWALDLILGRG
jgi:hypothetical protein